MAKPRKPDIEKLEDRVEEIHGKAAAVSVDKEHGRGCIVRVWNAKGTEILTEASGPSVAAAARSCLQKMRKTP